jgi:hypothetical protein
VRHGPTLTVSSTGCGAACQQPLLWKRVLGRAVEGAAASEAVCRGLVAVAVGGELQLLGLLRRWLRMKIQFYS